MHQCCNVLVAATLPTPRWPCRPTAHVVHAADAYSFWYSSFPSNFFDSPNFRTALLKSS
jgi:hypothetical protein